MKRKIKLGLTLLTTAVAFLGCKKDQLTVSKAPVVAKTATNIVSTDKISKVRKFISTILQVPIEKVTFDAISNKYIAGTESIEGKAIESLYEKANVYHAEYEGGSK